MIIVKASVDLSDIEGKLGTMSSQAHKVMKDGVYETGRQAKKDLVAQAKKEYATKAGNFTKAIKLKNSATLQHAISTIKVKGEQSELMDFKVAQGESIRAKVLKSSSMKEIVKGDLKAFITTFKSGHTSVVQRTGKGQQPAKSKLGDRYIKKLLSPSMPVIMANKKVLGKVEPKIRKNLNENIGKHIASILEGK